MLKNTNIVNFKRMNISINILLVLNLMDVLSTWYAVNYAGIPEQNPIVSIMFENNLFLLIKGVVITVGLLMMKSQIKLKTELSIEWKLVGYLLYVAIFVYSIGVITNIGYLIYINLYQIGVI